MHHPPFAAVTAPLLTLLLALPLVAACADDSAVTEGSGGADLITGVGGSTPEAEASAADQASAGSGWATSSASGTGGSGPRSPYPIVLAHGFFGFEEFAGLDFATYFYRVKDELAVNGESVVTPAVDPFNDSTLRGAQLAEHVATVLAETGADKVVLIGHSQGGLDARVVAHDHPDQVAAVITVATPHQGTPIADVLLGLVDDDRFGDLLDDFVRLVGGPLYDEVGDETSIAAPLRLLSQEGIAAFNAAYPDTPSVFYASISGRSGGHGVGGDCSPDVQLDWISRWTDQTDPVDPLLLVSEAIVSGGFDDVVNDGLIRARDAKRGEFWGCVPADHLDEIGHLFGDGPGTNNSFRHQVFWKDVVSEVRVRGF